MDLEFIMNGFTKIINLINVFIVKIQLILKPVEMMNTDDLITDNRFDINLRIKFLEEVVNNKKEFNKTRYYKFVKIPTGDDLHEDPDLISKKFINLYKNIKKIGFNDYFIVAKTNKFNKVEI